MPEAGPVGESEPQLRSFLHVLRRRKWIVLVVAAVLVATAVGGSLIQTRRYTATARVLISPSNTPVPLSPNGQTQQTLGTADIVTAQQLLTSTPVTDAVRSRLGTVPNVSTSEVGQTNVLSVSATSTNPQFAARTANAYAYAFTDFRRTSSSNDIQAAANQLNAKISELDSQINGLQVLAASGPPDQRASNQAKVNQLAVQEADLKTELAQLQVQSALSTGGAQVTTRAAVPTAPSSPNPVRNGLVALAVGVLLGIGLAFLRDYLDDSVKSREDLDRVAPNVPVIGVVPLVTSWKNAKKPFLVSSESPTSPPAEAYRTVRTSLQFLGLERRMRTVLVTSPSAREGKTTTIANLGVALAQAGQRVVAVSCDLRRPRLHSFVGQENTSGFTTALIDPTNVAGTLREVPRANGLWILTSGPLPPNPAELLAGEQCTALIGALQEKFDVVLIDSPPVLPVADAVILSGKVDATVMVVAAGETGRKELARSIELLGQASAPVVGMVLNEATRETGYGYSYRHSYQYGPHAETESVAPSVPAVVHSNGDRAVACERNSWSSS